MFKHNTYPVDSMPCGGLWRDEMHSVRPDCPRWWTTADQSKGDLIFGSGYFFPQLWTIFLRKHCEKDQNIGTYGENARNFIIQRDPSPPLPPPRPDTHGVVHWDEYNTFHHATTHHTALDSPYTSSVATFNLRITNEGDYRCSKLCFPQHKK